MAPLGMLLVCLERCRERILSFAKVDSGIATQERTDNKNRKTLTMRNQPQDERQRQQDHRVDRGVYQEYSTLLERFSWKTYRDVADHSYSINLATLLDPALRRPEVTIARAPFAGVDAGRGEVFEQATKSISWAATGSLGGRNRCEWAVFLGCAKMKMTANCHPPLGVLFFVTKRPSVDRCLCFCLLDSGSDNTTLRPPPSAQDGSSAAPTHSRPA